MCCISVEEMIKLLSGLLTPVIAALGVYIAYQQWKTNHNKLRVDLFERRYDVFLKFASFIANILSNGGVRNNEHHQFIKDTKGSRFIFGIETHNYSEEIFKKAGRLSTLDKLLENERDEGKRGTILEEHQKIEEWFQSELNGIEARFEKYLTLVE